MVAVKVVWGFVIFCLQESQTLKCEEAQKKVMCARLGNDDGFNSARTHTRDWDSLWVTRLDLPYAFSLWHANKNCGHPTDDLRRAQPSHVHDSTRKRIGTLRQRVPTATIELQYKGLPGNEKADKWISWLRTSPMPTEWGSSGMQPVRVGEEPPPRPFVHSKRDQSGRGRRRGRTSKEYWYTWEARQKPDSIPANVNKGLASRYHQLKTGHCLTGQ